LSPKAAALQGGAFGPIGSRGDAWLRSIEADARARVSEAAPAPAAPPLALGAAAPVPPRNFTVSLFRSATIERAFWFGALLLAFLLVRQRTVSERRAKVYRDALFSLFVLLAVVGILNRVSAPDRLLWIRAVPEDARPFGPYVNPSHFAGAMELGVPWMLGYGLWAVRSRRNPGLGSAKGILAILGAAIGAASALLAASKMAAVTIGVASVIVIAVAARRTKRPKALLAAGVVAAVLFFALAFYGPLRGRLADFESEHRGEMATNVRGLVWSAGARIVGDYALTGIGFGAFREVMPSYMPAGERELWVQLHNDYLEFCLEGGLVAVALLTWLTAGYVLRAVRSFRLESASGRRLSALGLVLGLVALAVHEVVDFNLQIPGNALLFVMIAAMGVSPLSRAADADA
jgi:O-antigen ligase